MSVRFIQVIDGAENCVYDIFSVSERDFQLLFPDGTDIAFAEDFRGRPDANAIRDALDRAWQNRVPKAQSQGIHGIIFYGLEHKRAYYPTRKDEEAKNPDGSSLR